MAPGPTPVRCGRAQAWHRNLQAPPVCREVHKEDPETGGNLIQEVEVLLSDLEVLPSLCDNRTHVGVRAGRPPCSPLLRRCSLGGFVQGGGTPAGLAATTRGQKTHVESPGFPRDIGLDLCVPQRGVSPGSPRHTHEPRVHTAPCPLLSLGRVLLMGLRTWYLSPLPSLSWAPSSRAWRGGGEMDLAGDQCEPRCPRMRRRAGPPL